MSTQRFPSRKQKRSTVERKSLLSLPLSVVVGEAVVVTEKKKVFIKPELKRSCRDVNSEISKSEAEREYSARKQLSLVTWLSCGRSCYGR